MPVAMMVDNPQGSKDIYEKVRAHLGLDAPAGGIFHCAGPSPNGGWRVIEVWETQEDAQRFRDERLLPAFEAVGETMGGVQPQFWPIHSHMVGAS
ncbi:MAG: hypothetical protein H0T39_15760 [Actinobacteria bacterium]|nr:hypothetical protein [Actinomycetota bacterium]